MKQATDDWQRRGRQEGDDSCKFKFSNVFFNTKNTN